MSIQKSINDLSNNVKTEKINEFIFKYIVVKS